MHDHSQGSIRAVGNTLGALTRGELTQKDTVLGSIEVSLSEVLKSFGRLNVSEYFNTDSGHGELSCAIEYRKNCT
jgi:hypothetical protein